MQLPQDLEVKCQKFGLKENETPKVQGSRMPVHFFSLIYASYWWFKSGERLLVEEEVQSIIRMLYGGKDSKRDNFHFLFVRLEDRNHNATTVLEGLEAQEKEFLINLVAPLFKRVLEDDPEAKQRDVNLSGL